MLYYDVKIEKYSKKTVGLEKEEILSFWNEKEEEISQEKWENEVRSVQSDVLNFYSEEQKVDDEWFKKAFINHMAIRGFHLKPTATLMIF